MAKPASHKSLNSPTYEEKVEGARKRVMELASELRKNQITYPDVAGVLCGAALEVILTHKLPSLDREDANQIKRRRRKFLHNDELDARVARGQMGIHLYSYFIHSDDFR